MSTVRQTTVLEVSGVRWASQQAVAESVLSRRPGVVTVDVNPVAQNATVTYDPAITLGGGAARVVRDCGYHCPDNPSPPTSATRWPNPSTQDATGMQGTTSTQYTQRRWR